jgi:hypothetical protein
VVPQPNEAVVVEVDTTHDRYRLVAGSNNNFGTSGNGVPALKALLESPTDLAISTTSRAIYFTDGEVVGRIDSKGIISTVAGGGTSLADGVPALQASLTSPGAIAVDRNEIIYVCEAAPASRVRRFTVNGKILTIAGTGISGFNGDGIPALRAQLSNPQGVATDLWGNVYISDQANYRVRRVDSSGIISTVAGTGEMGSGPDGVPPRQSHLDGPATLKIDAEGNLYVGEFFGGRIRHFKVPQ